MSLPGEGFIALWNDVDPCRSDYDRWHTIEHVPERMTVAGFLRAHRYVRSHGCLPEYFTLYALAELETLNRDAYLNLVAEPTAWSRNMRPDIRNFIRRVCRTIATCGEGVGGYAALALTSDLETNDAKRICQELLERDGVCAAHFGVLDTNAVPLEIDVEQTNLPPQAAGLFLVEGYSDVSLLRSCQALDQSSPTSNEWSLYKLAFELRGVDGETAAEARFGQSGGDEWMPPQIRHS
jgi:hypothetical protein